MVKLAIYPALGSFLLLVMAIGFAQLFSRDRATQNQDPETLAKNRKRGERRYRILMAIRALLLLACITLVPEPWQWFFGCDPRNTHRHASGRDGPNPLGS
jgi:hypothetical protein